MRFASCFALAIIALFAAQPLPQADGQSTALPKPMYSTERKVVFDCHHRSYPNARQQLYQSNPKLLALGEADNYCLATADLRDDGTIDIIAIVNFPAPSCDLQSHECKAAIYVSDKSGQLTDKNIFPVMIVKNGLSILTRKVNGWHLLATYNDLTNSGDFFVFVPAKNQYVEYKWDIPQ
jgi:hypothetical protein